MFSELNSPEFRLFSKSALTIVGFLLLIAVI
jgi:hypothetical protein